MKAPLSTFLRIIGEHLDLHDQQDRTLPREDLPRLVNVLAELGKRAEELEQVERDARALDLGWLIYNAGPDLRNADTTNVVFFPQRAVVSADVAGRTR